jgi:hypothetical protein
MSIINTYQKICPYLLAYGVVRTAINMTLIPFKEKELYVDRIGIFAVNAVYSPIIFPLFLYNDMTNIERKIRNLPTMPYVPGIPCTPSTH